MDILNYFIWPVVFHKEACHFMWSKMNCSNSYFDFLFFIMVNTFSRKACHVNESCYPNSTFSQRVGNEGAVKIRRSENFVWGVGRRALTYGSPELGLPNTTCQERGYMAREKGRQVPFCPWAAAVISRFTLKEFRQPMPGSPLCTNPSFLHSDLPLSFTKIESHPQIKIRFDLSEWREEVSAFQCNWRKVLQPWGHPTGASQL